MRTAFDTHVHLHSFYNLARGFDGARAALSAAAGAGGSMALCLSEAVVCDAFGALREGRWAVRGWTVAPTTDDLTLRMQPATGGEGLWILAGRQIVTRERIEVLALGLRAEISDRLATVDTIERVRSAGALPVLPWAPGKWFGGRGRTVASLMDRYGPDVLVLADSTLRPIGWPMPDLLRRGLHEGFRVLAGSDPLVFAGEERRIGRFASVVDGVPDESGPAKSILRLLGPGGPPLRTCGMRSCPVTVAVRILRHMRARTRAM